jgi:hypothetical protein
LVENTEVLCKDWKMDIPVALQHWAVSWYHHSQVNNSGNWSLSSITASEMLQTSMLRTSLPSSHWSKLVKLTSGISAKQVREHTA